MRKVITLSPFNNYGDRAQLVERRRLKPLKVSVRVRFQYHLSLFVAKTFRANAEMTTFTANETVSFLSLVAQFFVETWRNGSRKCLLNIRAKSPESSSLSVSAI